MNDIVIFFLINSFLTLFSLNLVSIFLLFLSQNMARGDIKHLKRLNAPALDAVEDGWHLGTSSLPGPPQVERMPPYYSHLA